MALRYKYKASNPLVKVVRKYAADNAKVGGWDIINEAYGDSEIEWFIESAPEAVSPAAAIAKVANLAGLKVVPAIAA